MQIVLYIAGLVGFVALTLGSLAFAAARTTRTGGIAAARCAAGGRRVLVERDFGRRAFDHRLRAGTIDDGLLDGNGNGCRLVGRSRVDLVLIAIVTVAVVVIATVGIVGTVVTREALLHLRLGGGNDAVVVLGVLQIVFRHDPVAGALGVAGKRRVFLGDVLGRAPDLHVRTRAVVGPRQGIATLTVVVVIVIIVVVIIVITPAAALVLLSWPHMSLT